MGNSASTSDIASLKSQVKALQTKTSDYADIKTKLSDASSNLAKSIDYESLAKKITDVSSYNQKIADALASNPGKLGEGLAAKMGQDAGVTGRIVTGLQDNTTFATTISSSLTNDASAFRGLLKGDKGAPGELASSKEAVKAALYDKKYTLWCADGEICQVPVGNAVLQIGSTIRSPGRMHITGEELLYLLNKGGVIIGKEWGGNGNLSVQGDLNAGNITSGGITSNGNLKSKGRLDVDGDAQFNGIWANAIKIGQWIFQQHPNGNLHIHRGNIEDWSMALTPGDGGNIHARGNFRTERWNKWL